MKTTKSLLFISLSLLWVTSAPMAWGGANPTSCTGSIGQACAGTTAINAGTYNGSNYMTTSGDAPEKMTWAAAGTYCQNLNYGGYSSGWYLPSKDELKSVLYANKAALGGFASAYYWSSTESSAGNAWAQAFNEVGYQYNRDETLNSNVRCVRTF